MSRAWARALLGLLACAGSARADEPAAPRVEGRVERPLIQRQGHLDLAASASYLIRDDFYRNPGVVVALGYWVREAIALEVQAGVYASYESDEARAVREQTGFVPDSLREGGTLAAGARWAFGYGKMLAFGRVIHLDPELSAHVGAHFASGTVGSLGDAGLGLGVWLAPRLRVRLDLPFVVESERRSGWTMVVGFAPALGLGILL
jgi:outer membrane beta-barrel protein